MGGTSLSTSGNESAVLAAQLELAEWAAALEWPDVPESVRSEVRFHLATTLADVLSVAFPPVGTEVPAAA